VIAIAGTHSWEEVNWKERHNMDLTKLARGMGHGRTDTTGHGVVDQLVPDAPVANKPVAKAAYGDVQDVDAKYSQ
jgi:hypothetical protein